MNRIAVCLVRFATRASFQAVFDSCIFERGIGRETLLGADIDREVEFADWAEPDFMIAFAVPDEVATMIEQ
jgi:predicted alpha/beta hydrolase